LQEKLPLFCCFLVSYLFFIVTISGNAGDNRLQQSKRLSRNDFERVLQDTLPDPGGEMTGGTLFRGDSYNFILLDRYIERPLVYSQALFSMYEVNKAQIRNFLGSEPEKRNSLKDAGIKDKNLIDELILWDQLVPIWGIIISDGLRNTYDRIIDIKENAKPESVTIYTETNPSGFCFYREKIKTVYPQDDVWK